MESKEIRDKYLKFFEERGHKIIASSLLIPSEIDSSVLFTTAGMQQFKQYYVGTKDAMSDFSSLNTASSQKCIRTSDIEEVGDKTHLTFFEMLGNFSFGGYFKKEAIEYAYDFIVKEMKLEIDYVSVFGGDEKTPFDKESFEIWREIGIPEEKIRKFGREDNFWGPTGDEGPCGPTTEIYINGVEIWNIVFNEYCRDKDGQFKKLGKLGVDTGMGIERLVVTMQKVSDVYETDLFTSIMSKIDELSEEDNIKSKRIIADHIKASVFIISDGVAPSNTQAGYVLRRLIRRAVRYGKLLGIDGNFISETAGIAINIYKETYPELEKNKSRILNELKQEEEKFRNTLEKGLKEFEKIGNVDVSGEDAFNLFSTYGFPLEMTIELAGEKNRRVDEITFWEEFKKHKDLSKTASAGMFKGGLADTGEQTTKYHTATHLLHQALREVLGNHVIQKGSNINADRLRFDFSHSVKMTPEEIERVESIVNGNIQKNLNVVKEEMSVGEAKEKGALGAFEDKYGEIVNVYKIIDDGEVISMEICGGPHVESTGNLGKFKIQKEESSSAGVRRIKAILE